MNDPIITCSSGEGKNVAISLIRVGGFLNLWDFQFLFSKDLKSLEPRKLYLSKIICPNEGLVDEATLVFFSGPNSYNGENILEIYAHGNRLTVKKIINLFIKNKLARLADPGEFTKRALVNKKLSLSQVEGLDLVLNAKNKAGLSEGLSLLSGGLNAEYEDLINSFEAFRSSLEVEMDFSGDVGEKTSRTNISKSFEVFNERLQQLCKKAKLGKKNFNSYNIGLFGLPNAGKSTFFNSILNRNRAIISEVKGTTRDYITEYIEINDEEFGLIDTAGLRETEDKIEALGVRSSYEFFDSSFYKVLLISGSELSEFTEYDLIKSSDLVVFTKCKNIESRFFEGKFNKYLKNKAVIFVDRVNAHHDLFLALLNDENYNAFLENGVKTGLLDTSGPIGPLIQNGPIGPELLNSLGGPIEPKLEIGPIGPNEDTETGPIGPFKKEITLTGAGYLPELFTWLIFQKYLKFSQKEAISLNRHIVLFRELEQYRLELVRMTLGEDYDLGLLLSVSQDVSLLLNDLIGVSPPEDLLNRIFGNFCIGK